MDEFREIHFEGSMLRVYKTGLILKYMKKKRVWKQLGLSNRAGYPAAFLNGRPYSLHRIIAMVYLGLDIMDVTQEIDHIDRCRTNNNIDNLRIVTHSQNMCNRVAKGYCWNKRAKTWVVQLNLNKNVIYKKSWKNEEDAAADYIKQKKKYHIINHNDTTQSVLLTSPVSDDLESMDA